eukprot:4898580-Pyramimonas_sp.AAC.1
MTHFKLPRACRQKAPDPDIGSNSHALCIGSVRGPGRSPQISWGQSQDPWRTFGVGRASFPGGQRGPR